MRWCRPWGGCVDSGGACGVVLKVSNRFFGAAVDGARFFFGFRPRLLGMEKLFVAIDAEEARLPCSRRPPRQPLCETPATGRG
jgi:hypothetical protein